MLKSTYRHMMPKKTCREIQGKPLIIFAPNIVKEFHQCKSVPIEILFVRLQAKSKSNMHIRRIGMFRSLLPLILSSLFIAITAIPRVPNELSDIINATQNGLPDIQLPSLPSLPGLQQDQPAENMDGNELAKEFLDLHNFARRHARLPPLVWDPKLEDYAKQYALKRKESGECSTLVHSMGPYGENLFWGRGSAWKPKDAVKKWVKEHRFYDADTNECRPGKMCGHYTQVVWRDTVGVGCAVEICPNNDTLTVCSYDPPGNYLGEKPSLHYIH